MNSFWLQYKKIILNIILLSYPLWGLFIFSPLLYSPHQLSIPTAFAVLLIWIISGSFLLSLIPIFNWNLGEATSPTIALQHFIIKVITIIFYIGCMFALVFMEHIALIFLYGGTL